MVHLTPNHVTLDVSIGCQVEIHISYDRSIGLAQARNYDGVHGCVRAYMYREREIYVYIGLTIVSNSVGDIENIINLKQMLFTYIYMECKTMDIEMLQIPQYCLWGRS